MHDDFQTFSTFLFVTGCFVSALWNLFQLTANSRGWILSGQCVNSSHLITSHAFSIGVSKCVSLLSVSFHGNIKTFPFRYFFKRSSKVSVQLVRLQNEVLLFNSIIIHFLENHHGAIQVRTVCCIGSISLTISVHGRSRFLILASKKH